MKLSVNKNVLKIIEQMIANKEKLKIKVEKTSEGTTIIDAGIEAQGGYRAGKYVTEVCMGGFGKVSFSQMVFNDLFLPAVNVITDFPPLALFGAQFAGWRISVGKYFAMGSGPARALALKPKDVYSMIDYRDEADTAAIVLEASSKPSQEVLEYIARECAVSLKKLYVIVTPTSSITGSIQISGRIVETGLHKLTEVGLDPKTVLSGMGCAPIAPVHPKSNKAMGRTNDMILYGGTVFFNIAHSNDDELKTIIKAVPSSESKDYGKPFDDIFKAARYNFYNIDKALFAPAKIIVSNVNTGKFFSFGKINEYVLRQSLTS